MSATFAADLDHWRERTGKVGLRPGPLGRSLDVGYFPRDGDGERAESDIGAPGFYPFTRGVYPAMYRDRMWQMRIYSGFGSPEDTNQRWRFLLDHGNMGVSAAFDLPTQCGYDSDNPRAGAEVGRVGVAVDSVEDFKVMFDGLPIDKLGISLNAHSTAPFVLAMFLAAAQEMGHAPGALSGSMTTDVLKDYVARGTWIYPPAHGLRLVGDLVEFCSAQMPRFYPLVVRGPDIRDAGATMAQEVGFAFANGMAYLDYARERGLDLTTLAKRLSAQFYFYGDFLQEAAKLRAARRLWARLLHERYGIEDPKALLLRVTASIGGTHFQLHEPEINIVRGTLGCLGAVLGGCQGMLLAGYDEAFDIPTEYTQRIALRTQQIVGYESDATATADPLGGSYFVEQMTDQIEAAAREKIEQIESMGGAVAAIESGFMQREIADSAVAFARAEQSGEKPLVAVNRFAGESEAQELVVHTPDEASIERKVAGLAAVKAARDGDAVAAGLRRLREAAAGDINLMPLLIECAHARTTLGEMVDTLKDEFGEFREPAL